MGADEKINAVSQRITFELSRMLHKLREELAKVDPADDRFDTAEKRFNVAAFISTRILANYTRDYLLADGARLDQVVGWAQVADTANVQFVDPNPKPTGLN